MCVIHDHFCSLVYIMSSVTTYTVDEIKQHVCCLYLIYTCSYTINIVQLLFLLFWCCCVFIALLTIDHCCIVYMNNYEIFYVDIVYDSVKYILFS